MDEADYIIGHLDEIASKAVQRQYQLSGGFWDRFGEEGKRKALEDASHHLRFLAEAVKGEEPPLFHQYVEWLKSLFAGLSFPPDTLETTFRVLKDTLSEVLPSGKVSKALSYIDAALSQVRETPPDPPSYLTGETELDQLARGFLSRLLEGKKDAAFTLIHNAFQKGTSLKDLYLKVFQRTQREVGRLWQLNRISVAQEHFCTAATQQIMASLYPHVFQGGSKTRRVVVACIGRELHEIGARMVADFFELEGWDSYFIGANTPADSILRIVMDQRPEVVGLSVTLSVHLSELRSLIPRLKSIYPTPRVLVGGYPFNIAPTLYKQVGADGYGKDAESAVLVANQLVGA